MFTGLVEGVGAVRSALRRGNGAELRVAAPVPTWSTDLGASVAVSGACLSVVRCLEPISGVEVPARTPGADMLFDLSAETLARTWFDQLQAGRGVNLERALCFSDRLDGHLVSGHVDGRGRLVRARDADDGGRVLTFEVEAALERFLVDKGSITLDGVSLTVVDPRGPVFDVALIPITLAKTTLGILAPGAPVNVEADQVGKWIDRLLAARGTVP